MANDNTSLTCIVVRVFNLLLSQKFQQLTFTVFTIGSWNRFGSLAGLAGSSFYLSQRPLHIVSMGSIRWMASLFSFSIAWTCHRAHFMAACKTSYTKSRRVFKNFCVHPIYHPGNCHPRCRQFSLHLPLLICPWRPYPNPAALACRLHHHLFHCNTAPAFCNAKRKKWFTKTHLNQHRFLDRKSVV